MKNSQTPAMPLANKIFMQTSNKRYASALIKQNREPHPRAWLSLFMFTINMKKLLYLIPLLALLFGSCKSNKDNLVYFRQNTPTAEQTVRTSDWKIKIEPGDKLSIYVTTDMQDVTNLFNLPPTGAGDDRMYLVDNEGNIKMPKIGTLHVAGLTTNQIAEEVTRKVAEFAEAPLVRVELENFKVNVIGEVNHPHTIKVDNERFSILDAIAAAGDLSIFGRRDNVTLIREEGGELTYNTIDLSDANLLSSPFFYLRQNDVIYVEPTETRKYQSEYSVNDSYKIQVVSTIVSGCSVIVSLIIALAIK